MSIIYIKMKYKIETRKIYEAESVDSVLTNLSKDEKVIRISEVVEEETPVN